MASALICARVVQRGRFLDKAKCMEPGKKPFCRLEDLRPKGSILDT